LEVGKRGGIGGEAGKELCWNSSS